MNSLQRLHEAGQSVWLDFIDRPILHNGELERRIRDDALCGMTSNPTIFEKALAEGSEYDAQLASAPSELSPWQLYELIETDDVRRACDLFAPVYESTKRGDGFVSIEVSPGAAHDVEASVKEARRLWSTVDRPNLMVKIPGTAEGAVAVRRLIAEGININITLLFGLDAYRAVIESYFAGLEDRLAAGKQIDQLASVASFFVSRVDTEADRRIEALSATRPPGESQRLAALRGKVGIANARLAYGVFKESTSTERWSRLAARGATLQRPLWASTSTKNPAYRDVMYVEELIGPNTVNTLPPATIEAFRDHGKVARTVDSAEAGSQEVVAELEALGISLDDITDTLLRQGLASFDKSFASLLSGLEKRTHELAHVS
jgi:transaldolase